MKCFQLIKDPYTYIEQVMEVKSEAVSLETSRHDGDTHSVATSSQNLVDSAFTTSLYATLPCD